jgi:hypothetical protein
VQKFGEVAGLSQRPREGTRFGAASREKQSRLEDAMRLPHVDDVVRLTQDIPNLNLQRGELGIVCATWFAPTEAYEVEFGPAGLDGQTRALLLAEQLQIEESISSVQSI